MIYAGIMLPFSTFLLCSFFSTISPSCSKQPASTAPARGAPSGRSCCRCRAGADDGRDRAILWVWNEVLIAVVFLQDQSLRTLMVGLTIFNSRYRSDVPMVMAGMLWATVPMVTLYLLGNGYFIRGLTAGAVKG